MAYRESFRKLAEVLNSKGENDLQIYTWARENKDLTFGWGLLL